MYNTCLTEYLRRTIAFIPYLGLLFLLFVISVSTAAQDYTTGALLDTAKVRSIPSHVTLVGADYRNLPARASLEAYCPVPGNQGRYGTCVGFAVGYYLRTILYVKGMREAGYDADPNAHVFSPSYIYEQIKMPDHNNCEKGSYPSDAFYLMQYSGAATLKTQPYSCGNSINPEAKAEASNFRILSYQTLYRMGETDNQLKVYATKKALSEGTPCMMVFKTMKSFHKVRSSGVWLETGDDVQSTNHGYHAMCVIGYDDTKFGGSFRVINSWGTAWGDNGYVWIPYREFAKYTEYVMSAQARKPPIKPDPNKVAPPDLKGSLHFQKNTGESMAISLVKNTWSFGDGFDYYKMTQTYPSGTRFRFFMNTNTDAYIYAFATDLTGSVNQIFPFDKSVSPLLGKNSTVAFPSEEKVIRMDDNKGTDYLLLLYAKQPLDVNDIIYKLRTSSGSLIDRAMKVLKSDVVHPSNISFEEGKAAFTVKGAATGAVVPLYIEIPHQ